MRPQKALVAVGVLALLTIGVRGTQEGREVKVNASQLPPAVKQALETNCPNCKIDKATREVENGVTIYDFEFKHGQGEMDVTADGLVVSRETVVPEKDVEAPALEAIRKAAAGGRIVQILSEKVTADLADGKVLKLDVPKYFYEAELSLGEEVAEIVVTPDGQVIEAPHWRKKGTKEP